MKTKNILLVMLFISFTGFLIIGAVKFCTSNSSICFGDPQPKPLVPTKDMGVTAECARPSHFPEEAVCKSKDLINILGTLRKFCQNGKCDVESFKKNAKTIAVSDFWKLLDQPSVHSFFYCSGKTEIDNNQFKRKSPDLIASLGSMIAVPENTAIFMMGKASAKGDDDVNRSLSAQRVQIAAKRITEIMSKTGSKWGCDNVYQTYVGEEAFEFSENKAQETNLFSSEDKREWRACGNHSSEFEDYLNQSVIVFTYPCLWEMCKSLFDEGKLSCDEAASADLRPTDECRKLLCECSP
jgi:hypothetical protein